MNTHARLLLALFALLLSTLSTPAQPPPLINYQGRLVDGTNLVNGSIGLSLRLFPQSVGGSILYEDSNTVAVADGLYSTFLGDNTTDGSLDILFQEDFPLYLETMVNGTALAPRERVGSVFYALLASNVVNGAITPAQVNLSSFDTTFWRVDGNAGTQAGTHFLGTTDGQPLDVKVGGVHALRIQASLTVPAVIGGSDLTSVDALADGAAVGGGSSHTLGAYASWAVIGGGVSNVIEGNNAAPTIGGGQNNRIAPNIDQATIAGGAYNLLGTGADASTIGGGDSNVIRSYGGVIAGGWVNRIATNSSGSTIGGGAGNTIEGIGFSTTISGGEVNTTTGAVRATIGGGSGNKIVDSTGATIAGGEACRIGPESSEASIGGGWVNKITNNSASATISGGAFNDIGAYSSGATIAGGIGNDILSNSSYAVIAGGGDNRIGPNAPYGFAAGRNAYALHQGAFVWGGSTAGYLAESITNDSVTMRASGGYRFLTASNLLLGAQLAPNATAWAALSDRNAKENFAPIDTAQILDRIAALPLTAWTYKHDPDQRRYIGPVAQDFHAAFGLGNDTTINTLDADGVALAAIQALAEENKRLRAELDEIKKRIGM